MVLSLLYIGWRFTGRCTSRQLREKRNWERTRRIGFTSMAWSSILYNAVHWSIRFLWKGNHGNTWIQYHIAVFHPTRWNFKFAAQSMLKIPTWKLPYYIIGYLRLIIYIYHLKNISRSNDFKGIISLQLIHMPMDHDGLPSTEHGRVT